MLRRTLAITITAVILATGVFVSVFRAGAADETDIVKLI